MLVLVTMIHLLPSCWSAHVTTTTEMSPLSFFLKNLFRSNEKVVKAGIVEPSPIPSSAEAENEKRPAIFDFLSSNDNKNKVSLSRRQESNSVFRNLFRSLAQDDLRSMADDDSFDDDLDLESTTTTRRPSLLLRGAQRVMGAIRTSTSRRWRNFLKSLLPSFFS